MTGHGYDAFVDPYLYPDSDCLQNLAGLRDSAELEAFELEQSTLRSEEALPPGDFDPAHYRRLHKHLFQDVYAWAGKDRTIRISKGGSMFCYPENITSQMNELFKTLRHPAFRPGSQSDAFIASAAYFLSELNVIHPFREGNGRTQLTFLRVLGQRAGHTFRVERARRETFIDAMVAGFHDDLAPLIGELENLLV